MTGHRVKLSSNYLKFNELQQAPEYARGTDFDNDGVRRGRAQPVFWRFHASVRSEQDTENEQKTDKNTALVTPLCTPRPPDVGESPPEPDPKGPYVVRD